MKFCITNNHRKIYLVTNSARVLLLEISTGRVLKQKRLLTTKHEFGASSIVATMGNYLYPQCYMAFLLWILHWKTSVILPINKIYFPLICPITMFTTSFPFQIHLSLLQHGMDILCFWPIITFQVDGQQKYVPANNVAVIKLRSTHDIFLL